MCGYSPSWGTLVVQLIWFILDELRETGQHFSTTTGGKCELVAYKQRLFGRLCGKHTFRNLILIWWRLNLFTLMTKKNCTFCFDVLFNCTASQWIRNQVFKCRPRLIKMVIIRCMYTFLSATTRSTVEIRIRIGHRIGSQFCLMVVHENKNSPVKLLPLTYDTYWSDCSSHFDGLFTFVRAHGRNDSGEIKCVRRTKAKRNRPCDKNAINRFYFELNRKIKINLSLSKDLFAFSVEREPLSEQNTHLTYLLRSSNTFAHVQTAHEYGHWTQNAASFLFIQRAKLAHVCKCVWMGPTYVMVRGMNACLLNERNVNVLALHERLQFYLIDKFSNSWITSICLKASGSCVNFFNKSNLDWLFCE